MAKKVTTKKVEEIIPEEKKNLVEIIKNKYEEKKYDIKGYSEDLTQKTKAKIEEKPLQSIAVVAGVSTLIGASIATSTILKMQDRHNHLRNYKKRIRKANCQFRGLSNQLDDDIRENPYQSLGVALGVGALMGVIGKSVMGRK